MYLILHNSTCSPLRHFVLFLFWLFIGTLVFITAGLQQSIPSAAVAAANQPKSSSITRWQKVPYAPRLPPSHAEVFLSITLQLRSLPYDVFSKPLLHVSAQSPDVVGVLLFSLIPFLVVFLQAYFAFIISCAFAVIIGSMLAFQVQPFPAISNNALSRCLFHPLPIACNMSNHSDYHKFFPFHYCNRLST